MKQIVTRLTIALVCALSFSTAANAARQIETTLRGTILEQSGEAAGYSTVYLSTPEGAMVCGTTADAAGRFELKAPQGRYILTASLVGFKDATQTVVLSGNTMDLPAIRLEEDSEMLGQAVVEAVMPKTKITGEGLATSVRGSILENSGTAKDVLGKVPGLIRGKDGLEVVGKGKPQIYINGRRMTDERELERLLSNEIQSVEVINNPGAQYNATVRSVVRIRTIRRKGEGFGFNVGATDEQSLQRKNLNDPTFNFNGNYRVGGLDFFGGFNAYEWSSYQESDLTQKTSGTPSYTQEETIDGEFGGKGMGVNGGVNWQIANNHFAGFKVDWSKSLKYYEDILMDGDIFKDGSKIDHLHTLNNSSNGNRDPYNIGANVYYNGVAGKLGIDFNADYYKTTNDKISGSTEESEIEDAVINANSTSESKLYAAKLVLSYPIWQGSLQFGTEDTFNRSSDQYSLSGASIPATSAKVSEDNIAAFVNYAFFVNKIGQISAGMRYEHIRYEYEDLIGDESFSRRYDNFYPTLSYAGKIGKVQAMISYSARTARPDFRSLSNAVRYNNRYTLQSGNAKLQAQSIQNFSATALWKFFSFVVNYDHADRPILLWADLYNDEGVIMLKPRNMGKPLRTLSSFISANPTLGPWNLSYTAGVMQNWLEIGSDSFSNCPMWFAQCNNTLTLKKGWQLELGGEYHSRGYMQNTKMTNNYLNVSAAIQKTLLRDGSLVLRLEGHDLAGLGRYNIYTNMANYSIRQNNEMKTQTVRLSVRYNFNTTASKYKGTGAGKDTRARMSLNNK